MRSGWRVRPGVVIGHNDAAPYNAAWRDGALTGFFDWDFAGPVTPEWDLAYAAFSWVPLHARSVVEQEGFTDYADRPRRLRLFLAEYGWVGPIGHFLGTVDARIAAHIAGLEALAAAGDPLFRRLVELGHAGRLEEARAELATVMS